MNLPSGVKSDIIPALWSLSYIYMSKYLKISKSDQVNCSIFLEGKILLSDEIGFVYTAQSAVVFQLMTWFVYQQGIKHFRFLPTFTMDRTHVMESWPWVSQAHPHFSSPETSLQLQCSLEHSVKEVHACSNPTSPAVGYFHFLLLFLLAVIQSLSFFPFFPVLQILE